MMDMLVIADIILIDSFRTYADGADVDYLIRFSSSLILCLNSLDSWTAGPTCDQSMMVNLFAVRLVDDEDNVDDDEGGHLLAAQLVHGLVELRDVLLQLPLAWTAEVLQKIF